MKIAAARIFVRDIQAAIGFYCLLGLEVAHYDSQSGYCVFSTGETRLIIEVVPVTAPEQEQDLVGRFTGLSFPADDIAKSYQYLQSKGVRLIGEPEQQVWGGWLLTLADPDGNEIQLVQENQ